MIENKIKTFEKRYLEVIDYYFSGKVGVLHANDAYIFYIKNTLIQLLVFQVSFEGFYVLFQKML